MRRTWAYWLMLTVSFAVLAQPAYAVITEEMRLGYNGGDNAHPHNLSSLSKSNVRAPTGAENQICVFCHTPHGASARDKPLWNRKDPVGPSGNGSFPLYAGSVEIKTIADANYRNDGSVEYPNGTSRMCLSCHDGVSAVGEVIGGQVLANLSMSAQGTIDLAESHPISFVYNGAVIGELVGRGKSFTASANPRVKVDHLNRVQCTTCHDPHVDTKNGTTYTLPMWANYVGTDEDDDYVNTCNSCHSDFAGTLFPGGGGGGHDGY